MEMNLNYYFILIIPRKDLYLILFTFSTYIKIGFKLQVTCELYIERVKIPFKNLIFARREITYGPVIDVSFKKIVLLAFSIKCPIKTPFLKFVFIMARILMNQFRSTLTCFIGE